MTIDLNALQAAMTAAWRYENSKMYSPGREPTCTPRFNDFEHGSTTAAIEKYLEVAKGGDETEEVQADQWDESVRGKKMSDSAGRVIFKYQMPVLERFTMRLPKGAQIIRMADQGGMFWLWAVVDTREPDEDRHFVAVKCGANVPEIPDLVYHGFCAVFVQQELGLYIFEDISHGQD